MNTLESILKELISARVEQLAHEAEQHPDCVKSKEQMQPLRTKAEQLMGEDDVEELVSMTRGCDIPVYVFFASEISRVFLYFHRLCRNYN